MYKNLTAANFVLQDKLRQIILNAIWQTNRNFRIFNSININNVFVVKIIIVKEIIIMNCKIFNKINNNNNLINFVIIANNNNKIIKRDVELFHKSAMFVKKKIKCSFLML